MREESRGEEKSEDRQDAPHGERYYTLPVRLLRASVVLLFVACASTQEIDTLYFGTNKPAGVVTDREWRTFVNEVITPRFTGFTEWTATGHWRGEEEKTHVVQIAQPDRDRIVRIINEYKLRFAQESVLWVRSRALVTPQ